jgi:hypothetical protein
MVSFDELQSLNMSSLEAKIFSAIQEIHRILWNRKFHYRFSMGPPFILIPNLPFIHLRLGLQSVLFPSSFPIKDCMFFSPSPNTYTCLPIFSLFLSTFVSQNEKKEQLCDVMSTVGSCLFIRKQSSHFRLLSLQIKVNTRKTQKYEQWRKAYNVKILFKYSFFLQPFLSHINFNL